MFIQISKLINVEFLFILLQISHFIN